MRHIYNEKLTAFQEKTVLEDSSISDFLKTELLRHRSTRTPLPENIIAELEEYFNGRAG
jgi:hypothetical protein